MKKKIQLSISLLASDRPETLKKCLDSLMPILEALPSELIVVFTGESPETEALIRQYPGQIVPFTWCNDFSAARNAGLELASGEWFLFIDDDEWFEDTGEIVRFFRTGEYKRYLSASYLQRNYTKEDGSAYDDFEAIRMTRRTAETRFRYPIHEDLHPLLTPVKKLRDFVHHYGYAKYSLEKSARNVPLLLEALEKDPKNVKMYMQLGQEFINQKQYRTGETYCRRGIEVSHEGDYSPSHKNWLLAYYLQFIREQQDMERVWEEGERILSEERPMELPRAHIYFLLAETGMSLERYEDGMDAVHKYIDMLHYLKKHPKQCDLQKALGLTYEKVADKRNGMYLYGLEYAVKLGNFAAVEKFLRRIQEDKDEKNKNFYMEHLDEWKERNKEYTSEILECFSHLTDDDGYVSLQRALYYEQLGGRPATERFFRKSLDADEPYLEYQLLCLAVRNGFDIASFIRRLNLSVWTEYARRMVHAVEVEDCEKLARQAEKTLLPYPLYYAILQRFLLEKTMRQGTLEGQELSAVTEQYAKSVVGYYRCLYKEELFAEDGWFCLPEICCSAMLLVNALESEREGAYHECMEALRKVLKIQPDMKPVVTKLLESVEREIEAASLRQPVSEFASLGAQVKATVRDMIANKQYAEAVPVLEQLTELLPGDAEVAELKEAIRCEENWGGINEKLRRTSLPVLEKEIYQYLRLLRQQNRGAYKKLVDYYNTYPFWGGLDPDKKNFETLKRRAAVLKNHREDLDWLHSRLGDTLSKNTLSAILKNWLVFDCSDIVSVTRPAPDYFDTSLIPSGEGEVLVDLGAYTGDTIQDFVNTYGNSYKKIYAYEITKEILPILEENTKYFHDVTIVNKAAGSQAGTLYVQAGSDASANTLSDDETNGYSVEVTAIDDDIPEPVTFIKMDIEGAEAEALLGCKRQIQENHPKLAVCLYHGYDDLWKLPRMIEEMDPTYQFYLRHYGGNLVPTEFVLLAI